MPGYLLKLKHTEQAGEKEPVLYYYPSGNTAILEGVEVSGISNMRTVFQQLRDLDVEAELTQDR